MKRISFRQAAIVIAVGVLYVACAKLGFAFAFRAAQVTTIWPPTGFALAAVFRFRGFAALGVLLGAFVANATADEPVAVAATIAVGNTLEAIAGAMILGRVGFDARLRRVFDVLALVATVVVAPIISATIGVLALGIGGVQPMSSLPELWWIWWIGDALGGLTVGAPLLIWSAPDSMTRRRGVIAEAAAMLAVLFVSCAIVFSLPARTAGVTHFVYVFFIWAALRLGPACTATAVLLASIVAVWGTDAGQGPFAGAGPERGLVLLQFFMGAASTTALTLAAVAAQQKALEDALRHEANHKDEFLAMLGHELRNPLAPILHAAELIDRGDPSAGIIRRQAKHLSRLVDDLLDISRISRGKIRVEKRIVTLADIVADAIETWRHLIDQQRQRLSIDIPREPVWLLADPARMTQAIANLLHNASKFTPEGGSIAIVAREEDGAITLSVRDSGAGMTPEVVEHAFELFVQGPPPLNRPHGGLGLGLTLVHRLVELHEGTVTAASAGPGQGSEFTIRLRAEAEPTVRTRQRILHPEEPRAQSRRKILVVEDNADACQVLCAMLRRAGHEVRAAADGASALAEAEKFAPEVVLLDIGLPGMDGYEVAQRFRAMPQTAKATLIALTGYGHNEDRERSRAAGIDHHLLKPVERSALMEAIARG